MLETDSGILLPNNYQIYVKPTEREISQRKLESYQKRIKDIENRVVYENAKMSDAMCKEVLECRTHIKNILEKDNQLRQVYIDSNSQALKDQIEVLKE